MRNRALGELHLVCSPALGKRSRTGSGVPTNLKFNPCADYCAYVLCKRAAWMLPKQENGGAVKPACWPASGQARRFHGVMNSNAVFNADVAGIHYVMRQSSPSTSPTLQPSTSPHCNNYITQLSSPSISPHCNFCGIKPFPNTFKLYQYC
jgi:hypothetical protein